MTFASADRTLHDEPAQDIAGTRSWDLHIVLESARPLAGGLRISLEDGDEVLIGRGPTRTMRREGRNVRVDIPSEWLSRDHVRVRRHGDTVFASDGASRNGTFIDGNRVDHGTLPPRSLLEVGRVFCSVTSCIVRAIPTSPEMTPPLGLRSQLRSLEERYFELLRLAKSAVPVLLAGPSGSGKELVGRGLHEASGRRGSLVAVNCGALPASLLESLLFGHVRGAFSGALRDEPGYFRAADGGTLFLDEIGDLPLVAQAALLRALQEGNPSELAGARGGWRFSP
jgi:hypothetical protein